MISIIQNIIESHSDGVSNLEMSEEDLKIVVKKIFNLCENYALKMVNEREIEIKEMLVREDLNWLAEAIILTKKL